MIKIYNILFESETDKYFEEPFGLVHAGNEFVLYDSSKYPNPECVAAYIKVKNTSQCPAAIEIANSVGVGDIHDGSNYMRSACVIAISKARAIFEPPLEVLKTRMIHIFKQLFPLIEYILIKDNNNIKYFYYEIGR